MNIIYCDGACSNNGKNSNIGGYGGIIYYEDGHFKEYHGATYDTTNNKMEMMAVINGLIKVHDYKTTVKVFTDSYYVVHGTKYFLKNGFKKKNGEPVANLELWKTIATLLSKFNKVIFVHVRGHSGNKGNERADFLAKMAIASYKPVKVPKNKAELYLEAAKLEPEHYLYKKLMEESSKIELNS